MAASRKEGLRPLQPKKSKLPKKSNAERCREYRNRMKICDPEAYELLVQRRKASAKRYYQDLGEERQSAKRERDRINQRNRRKRLKLEKGETSRSTKSAAQNTRSRRKKHERNKEKNRLSQQKRRALMTPQEKKWELKKQRDRYWRSKSKKPSPERLNEESQNHTGPS